MLDDKLLALHKQKHFQTSILMWLQWCNFLSVDKVENIARKRSIFPFFHYVFNRLFTLKDVKSRHCSAKG